MYKVIEHFRDLEDGGRYYAVGDTYPVPSAKPTKARIDALLNGTNKNGVVYIEEIPDSEPEKTPPEKGDNGKK